MSRLKIKKAAPPDDPATIAPQPEDEGPELDGPPMDDLGPDGPVEEPIMKPREPGMDGPPGLGGPDLPMDGPGGQDEIHIDSTTGEVTLNKNKLKITIAADNELGNLPLPDTEFGDQLRSTNSVPALEEDPHWDDTHDNWRAIPKNRIAPPLFEVTLNAGSDIKAAALAYSLNTTYALRTEAKGAKVVCADVMDPVALLSEMGHQGVTGEVTGGDKPTKIDPGVKVAIMVDIPHAGYAFCSDRPVSAMVLAGKNSDGEYLIDTPWGHMYAKEYEIRKWNEL